MADGTHPKLENIELDASYILDVIYDDESLTLEIEFRVLDGHPRFEAGDGEDCYRPGFIQFTEVDDLRIKNSASPADKGDAKYAITSATIDGDYAFIDSSWGEIELTAQSIRVVVD